MLSSHLVFPTSNASNGSRQAAHFQSELRPVAVRMCDRKNTSTVSTCAALKALWVSVSNNLKLVTCNKVDETCTNGSRNSVSMLWSFYLSFFFLSVTATHSLFTGFFLNWSHVHEKHFWRRSLRVLHATISKQPVPIQFSWKNKMQPTNPNAHTYVHGTDVEAHGDAVTQNTFLQ